MDHSGAGKLAVRHQGVCATGRASDAEDTRLDLSGPGVSSIPDLPQGLKKAVSEAEALRRKLQSERDKAEHSQKLAEQGANTYQRDRDNDTGRQGRSRSRRSGSDGNCGRRRR